VLAGAEPYLRRKLVADEADHTSSGEDPHVRAATIDLDYVEER
jgi:hypothetical protein